MNPFDPITRDHYAAFAGQCDKAQKSCNPLVHTYTVLFALPTYGGFRAAGRTTRAASAYEALRDRPQTAPGRYILVREDGEVFRFNVTRPPIDIDQVSGF